MKKALLGSTAAVLAFGLPATAYAQDADSSEAASALDDEDIIIVTATRRAQDVQDIPIAVTAVSPVQLERQGVVNVGQEITNVSSSFSTSTAQLRLARSCCGFAVSVRHPTISVLNLLSVSSSTAHISPVRALLCPNLSTSNASRSSWPTGYAVRSQHFCRCLEHHQCSSRSHRIWRFRQCDIRQSRSDQRTGRRKRTAGSGHCRSAFTGAYRQRDGYVTVVDQTGNEVGESNGSDQYLVRGQLGFETDSGISGRLIGDYAKSYAGCCAAIEVLQSPVETWAYSPPSASALAAEWPVLQ